VSDNVPETIRATVQDFLAPEMRTHGVRLDNLERRLDDTRQSREHRIEESKETIRAEMRALEARLEGHIGILEALLRGLIRQVSGETALRERVASLEARMPKQ
jgi:hypothetical protein